MNVLFLTCHLPFPPWSGGRLREFEMLRRLGARHRVEVCAVTRTLEHDHAHAERVRAFASVHLFPSPTDGSSLATVDASFLVRRVASVEAAAFVAERLARGGVDLVHCEGFYMRVVVGKADIPLFLMEQNIEYRVWPREARRIRAEEVRAWRGATRCGALTEADAAVMRRVLDERHVLISFNGSDHATTLDASATTALRPLPAGPIVLCPGNFAYAPSYEAGARLCTSVGPAILERVPEATVLLVGNASERLIPLVRTPRIEVHGAVPSLEPYYAAATVVACPLRRGGGIKVKLLEALARGCAVVTTDVGRQGLEEAPLVVAGTLRDFVDGVAKLLVDCEARAALQVRAAAFGAGLSSWDAAAERLHHCWTETVRARRHPPPAGSTPRTLTNPGEEIV